MLDTKLNYTDDERLNGWICYCLEYNVRKQDVNLKCMNIIHGSQFERKDRHCNGKCMYTSLCCCMWAAYRRDDGGDDYDLSLVCLYNGGL